jgi:hypothetical protein
VLLKKAVFIIIVYFKGTVAVTKLMLCRCQTEIYRLAQKSLDIRRLKTERYVPAFRKDSVSMQEEDTWDN